MPESKRYADLRQRYRPTHVKLLLIGESAPDPGAAEPRFFYAPTLTAADNLFRGVVLALYDHRFPRGSAGSSKVPWLERLQADGVFLIDLVPFPVNALGSGARARARRDAVPDAVESAAKLAPDGIIVCHDPSFRVLREPLRAAGLPLLHDTPIPFPLGNKREQFADAVRSAWPQARYRPADASSCPNRERTCVRPVGRCPTTVIEARPTWPTTARSSGQRRPGTRSRAVTRSRPAAPTATPRLSQNAFAVSPATLMSRALTCGCGR